MVLYLINEATDAKRQPRLAITEPRRFAITRSEIAMVERACALLNERK